MRTNRELIVPVALWAMLLAHDAVANVGIPMLVLAWPALWIALAPVVVFEAFLGTRRLKLQWRPALKVSLIANLWSTLAGVPAAWVGLLALEMLVGYTASALGADRSWNYILFPFMIAWIGPTENAWIVYLAFVLLAIPFCWVSIWIEGGVAVKRLRDHPPKEVRSWVLHANVWSYILLVACSIAFPLSVHAERAT